MEELAQERLAELLDTSAVFGREVSELAHGALQLGGAQRVHARAELFDRRDNAESAIPGPEMIGLFLDDSLGGRNLIATARGGLRRHRLKIVDIVQEYVLELRDRWIDIAWNSEIENAQRSSAAAGDDVPHPFPCDARVRRGGRAKRDIGRRKIRPRVFERHRAAAQTSRDR